MKNLLFAFSLILISATAQGFEIKFGNDRSELPEWVASPLADDRDYIYGVGDGRSLAAATQSALNSISGKLATVVSSNISANTTLRQGKASVYFSEDVSTKTFDTKLSSYEVERSTFQNETYYVMVKMSRNAFVNDTKARLKIIDDRLNSHVVAASKISKLQHYLALNEVKSDIVEASTLVLLLQAASPTFDAEKYLFLYRKLQSESDALIFQLHVKVEAPHEMRPVAEMLVSLLGEKGISASLGGTEQSDATINVTGGVQNKILFSEYTTQLRVNTQIQDRSGRKLNSKERVVAGSSMSSYDLAMRAAVNRLKEGWEDDGVLAVLGLPSGEK